MDNNNKKKNENVQVKLLPLKYAIPPSHSIFFVLLMILFFTYNIPSLESIDEIALKRDTFIKRIHPNIFSLQSLFIFRLVCTIIIFSTSVYMALWYDGGWTQQTNYLKGTKLIKSPIHMRYIKTQLPFTSWSWNLLGLSFLCNTIIVGMHILNSEEQPPKWLLRLSLVIYETSLPLTLLVASVIKYAIWPRALKGGGKAGTETLRSLRVLLQHNANVIMSLLEIGLVGGGIPIRIGDYAFAPLFGLCYIIFTWFMQHSWISKSNTKSKNNNVGPQFIYFFFDTTLPGYTPSIALLGLLVVLLTFYVLFVLFDELLALSDTVVWNLFCITSVSALVCRFRD